MPPHHAPGTKKVGRAQCFLAYEQARSEAQSAGKLVGLGLEHGADLDRCGTDSDACPRREVEARQEGRIGGGTECTVAMRQNILERLSGVELHRAVERISGIDRL